MDMMSLADLHKLGEVMVEEIKADSQQEIKAEGTEIEAGIMIGHIEVEIIMPVIKEVEIIMTMIEGMVHEEPAEITETMIGTAMVKETESMSEAAQKVGEGEEMKEIKIEEDAGKMIREEKSSRIHTNNGDQVINVEEGHRIMYIKASTTSSQL
jgi:hypothetical protein